MLATPAADNITRYFPVITIHRMPFVGMLLTYATFCINTVVNDCYGAPRLTPDYAPTYMQFKFNN